jgi:hypothetical protein
MKTVSIDDRKRNLSAFVADAAGGGARGDQDASRSDA